MSWKPIKKRRTARSDSPAPSDAAGGAPEARSGGGTRASSTPGRRPGRFRGWRGWLLRVSLVVLSPLLVFGLLEGGLRVADYG